MSDFLHPYEHLDVLGRYGKIAPYLNNFLKDKEIATKIIWENFVVLKRWTKLQPLYIKDLDIINADYLRLRADHHLDDMKKQLTAKQILIWQYFVPRKLVNFFYACNNEYGNKIDRIFIDIDRQTNSPDDARKVTLQLIKTIKSDKEFLSLIDFKNLITLRTWSSFHIYIMLSKTINHFFYETYLSYGKGKEHMFMPRRAESISKETKLTVLAGHERKKWALILDTSNTPSGKLARCPFSLHIKDAKTIDGICIPISESELTDPKLIWKLQKLTPEIIWKNIEKYINLL